MRESIHKRVRAPENAKAIEYGRRSGYNTGGAVHEDEEEDKKLVKRMMRKREKGEPIDKLKSGGKMKGKEPRERLDKRPRKAGGGMLGNAGMQQLQGMGTAGLQAPTPAAIAPAQRPMAPPAPRPGGAMMNARAQGGGATERTVTFNRGGAPKQPKVRARGGKAENGGTGMYHGTRATEMEMKQPETNVDSEGPPKKAAGGSMGHGHKGKKSAKTNIIIHTGGAGPGGGADPAALQQAKMQGAKAGAQMVIQKLKGAGAGGPPGMGGAPPPGAMPPGGPMGAPPGAGAPPPMPMHAEGGKVEKPKLHKHSEAIKVRAHTRRRGGAC